MSHALTSQTTADSTAPAWIRPEIVAGKLAAIKNLEYPRLLDQITERLRLVELLWHIQFISTQPGGHKKFTEDVVAEFPDAIGTKTMVQTHRNCRGRYTIEQAALIWEEIPWYCREAIKKGDNLDYWQEFLELDNPANIYLSLAARALDQEAVPAFQRKALEREEKERREAKLAKLTRDDFYQVCKAAALIVVPRYLAALCNEPGKLFEGIWCFPSLIETLIQMMDRHAQKASEGLAKTEVAVKVFDSLDYALSEGVLVQIQGDSRFGKTEAVQTWCAMRPGRARLVTVPCSNCDADFFKAVADALGIVYGLKTTRQETKDAVEYVLRHGRLMIVFDEAHWALPVRYSETTPPMRLNWIRTQIVDRHIPCALVATPQSYHQAVNKFVRKTGYSIEQFLGRVAFQVNLPTELSEADLIAVARIHFPELDDDYLGLIAAKAMQSEAYLKAVENISRRTRYIAKRAGRTEIQIDDVDLAISEVLPIAVFAAPAKPAQQATRRSNAHALQRPGNVSEIVQKTARRDGNLEVNRLSGETDLVPSVRTGLSRQEEASSAVA